jgi:hypothetical protein
MRRSSKWRADGVNLKDWVKRQYSPALEYLLQDKEPRFLCLDAFAPQMTKNLRDEFKKLNCTTLYIPGGCTGFVQVLDVSLNKPLKALVAQAASDHADKYHKRYIQESEGFSVADRWVLLTQWVAEAWKELHEKYKDTIIQTFQRVGLSLNPDGSEDSELKIKGIENIIVGDFSRKEPELENGLGSLTAVDVIAVEAAQEKLAARVANTKAKEAKKRACNDTNIAAGWSFPLYNDDTTEGYNSNNPINVAMGHRDPTPEEDKSSEDDEGHDEVYTLGGINTRSQTRVNCYFTEKEVALEASLGQIEEELDSDDNEEPEYDPDEVDNKDGEFDDDIQGDQDVGDEDME